MGFGGISIWQLLIILVIVLLLFGTKRLKNIGGDLGSAIKGFKKSMSDEEKAEAMGLHTLRYKLVTWAMAAFFVGMVGGEETVIASHTVRIIPDGLGGFIQRPASIGLSD